MLEKIRKSKGLSQEQLANLVRLHGAPCTQADISLIEVRGAQPNATQKEALANILGVKQEELFK